MSCFWPQMQTQLSTNGKQGHGPDGFPHDLHQTFSSPNKESRHDLCRHIDQPLKNGEREAQNFGKTEIQKSKWGTRKLSGL